MKSIVDKLNELNKTIATMESCTGGHLVNEITNIPGASNILKFSAITYSNEYKVLLGIDKDLIEKYTVYSKEVASAMAKRISDIANSSYGIGITGKLNRVDQKNNCGIDNQVFFSIFDRESNKLYEYNMFVTKLSRKENKEEVINEIIIKLKEILFK